jgi:hypothetical protein
MLIEDLINRVVAEGQRGESTDKLAQRIMQLRHAQNELAAIAIAINRNTGYSIHPGQLDRICQRMHAALNKE